MMWGRHLFSALLALANVSAASASGVPEVTFNDVTCSFFSTGHFTKCSAVLAGSKLILRNPEGQLLSEIVLPECLFVTPNGEGQTCSVFKTGDADTVTVCSPSGEVIPPCPHSGQAEPVLQLSDTTTPAVVPILLVGGAPLGSATDAEQPATGAGPINISDDEESTEQLEEQVEVEYEDEDEGEGEGEGEGEDENEGEGENDEPSDHSDSENDAANSKDRQASSDSEDDRSSKGSGNSQEETGYYKQKQSEKDESDEAQEYGKVHQAQESSEDQQAQKPSEHTESDTEEFPSNDLAGREDTAEEVPAAAAVAVAAVAVSSESISQEADEKGRPAGDDLLVPSKGGEAVPAQADPSAEANSSGSEHSAEAEGELRDDGANRSTEAQVQVASPEQQRAVDTLDPNAEGGDDGSSEESRSGASIPILPLRINITAPSDARLDSGQEGELVTLFTEEVVFKRATIQVPRALLEEARLTSHSTIEDADEVKIVYVFKRNGSKAYASAVSNL